VGTESLTYDIADGNGGTARAIVTFVVGEGYQRAWADVAPNNIVRTGTTATPTDLVVTSVAVPQPGWVEILEAGRTTNKAPGWVVNGENVRFTFAPAAPGTAVDLFVRLDDSMFAKSAGGKKSTTTAPAVTVTHEGMTVPD